MRAAWISLPLAAGPVLGDALADASGAVQRVASVGLWAGWTVGVLATLVPRPLGLTALRSLAPGSLAAVVAASAGGHVSAGALVASALVTALVLAPETARWSVGGAAYAGERRFPLRPPGPLLLGPLPLAWAVATAGVATGPLLLAARQWATGAAAVVVGLPLAAVLLRSLHGLSRRWVVFVPAGLVLHDPLSLVDPVLFPRQAVEALGPAPSDTDALDLTQRALGLALELRLREPGEVILVRPGRKGGERAKPTAMLFTPSRPGEVLAEAASRRIGVAGRS